VPWYAVVRAGKNAAVPVYRRVAHRDLAVLFWDPAEATT